ncbi:MAG: hypothetical protein LBK99_22540 [Opitutaceae bacterium]|jgi:hypothetical protein|nr:hypothetical protein [Opitutaceae bacterium]
MKTYLSVSTACSVLLAICPIVQAESVFLDFESEGQFANNFRALYTAGGTAAQTTTSGSNGFVKHDRQTTTDKGIAYLYDTTPADATVATQSVFVPTQAAPLTVSFDLYAASTSSAFAIIFADASNANNNLTAMFKVDVSNKNDQFNFYRDGNVTTDGLLGTQVGTTSTQATAIDVSSSSTFTTGGGFSVTLSVVDSTPTLSLIAGGIMVEQTFSSGNFDWTDTTVILRLYDSGAGTGNGVGIDNFSITNIPVPEPAHAVALLALIAAAAAAGVRLVVRRRQT